MSKKEVGRLEVVQRVVGKRLRQAEAAQQLGFLEATSTATTPGLASRPETQTMRIAPSRVAQSSCASSVPSSTRAPSPKIWSLRFGPSATSSRPLPARHAMPCAAAASPCAKHRMGRSACLPATRCCLIGSSMNAATDCLQRMTRHSTNASIKPWSSAYPAPPWTPPANHPWRRFSLSSPGTHPITQPASRSHHNRISTLRKI